MWGEVGATPALLLAAMRAEASEDRVVHETVARDEPAVVGQARRAIIDAIAPRVRHATPLSPCVSHPRQEGGGGRARYAKDEIRSPMALSRSRRSGLFLDAA